MAISQYYISCTKLVSTSTLNDNLRPIKTYAETSIKGYLGSGNDNEVGVAGKETVRTRLRFYCGDFTLDMGNLVVYEGNTYEVVSEPKNTAHKNHHIKVLVVKVDNVKQQ